MQVIAIFGQVIFPQFSTCILEVNKFVLVYISENHNHNFFRALINLVLLPGIAYKFQPFFGQ